MPPADADGKVRGRDGRSWLFDRPEAVLAASPDRIAVDINHSTDLAAPRGGEAPAAGWIAKNSLQVRDGAIYGKPAWNARGKAAIEGEEYAYLSPVFDYDAKGRVTRLVRVSLVNNPNFDLALNAEDVSDDAPTTDPEPQTMKTLLALLGLKDTATEAEAVTALNSEREQSKTALNAASTPSLDKFVPRADFDAVQTRALNAERQLSEGNKAAREAEITKAIDEAVAAGKVAPASKEFYRATCQAEGGLEKFREFVKGAPTILEPGATVTGEAPGKDKTALNASQEEVRKSLGLSEEEFRKTLESNKSTS